MKKHVKSVVTQLGRLLVLFIFASFIMVTPAEGQTNDAKITISCNNEPMPQVLKKVEKLSKYKVLFTYDEIANYKVSLDVKEATIAKTLSEIIGSYPLKYTIRGSYITISTKNISSNEKIINGLVEDMSGEPLPGARVSIKGAPINVASDVNGFFYIIVPDSISNAVLVFDFIGMKSREIRVAEVNSSLPLKVIMDYSKENLDEVVVTGIFERKKESFTGAATTIKGSELARVSNQNLFQSLKNLDPSLNILTDMNNGSNPNSLPDMKMRGTSTFPSNDAGTNLKGNYIGSPNAPLFIVDGFESTIERVFDMDMNRIESVTLLKDASAKALYGSKASNGVIVIETKRLVGNESRVTYNGNITFEMPDLTSYDLCNAVEKLKVEDIENYYHSSGLIDEDLKLKKLYSQRLLWAESGNSTYWLSKPLRIGIGNKHTISVELGEKALKAIANFSYSKTNGVMKGSDRSNLSGDINLMYRYKKILFKNIMSIQSVKGKDSPYGTFSQYALLNPYWYPKNEDGTLKRYLTEAKDPVGIVGNPLYDARLSTKISNSYSYINNNFYVEAEIVRGLKAIASLGVSSKSIDGEEFYPSNHSKFLSYTSKENEMRKGSYSMIDGKSSSVNGKIDFQYNKLFNDKHLLFADISFQAEESKYSEYTFMAEGFPSDKMENISFARQYAKGTTPQGADVVTRNVGFLSYLSYSYDNRYITDLTYRVNGASVFGNDNPWANFWSAGIAWNVNNEKFLKNVKNLNTLKLRASYGLTGNQNFQTNTSFAIYNYNTNGQYNGFIGAVLSNMENNNLMWEQKKELNAGFDLDYWRLSLRFDYYNSLTSDMITSLPLAPSTGFSSVRENMGEVRNKGIEVSLNFSLLRNKNGFLNLYASMATNKNKIEKLSSAMDAFNKTQMEVASKLNHSEPVLKYVEGMPLNAIWAVPSLGIDPMTGKEVFLTQSGEKTYKWDAANMVNFGSSDPKFNGIIGISGEYKGFGLSVAATYLGGGKYYNYTLVNRVEDVDIGYNVDRRVLTGRWMYPGQNSQFSSLREQYTTMENGLNVIAYEVTRATSRFIQNRNELDISSISAYYNFNSKLLEKFRMKQLKLAFYINNIATLSSIKIERGISYPFARTMSFSLTATF